MKRPSSTRRPPTRRASASSCCLTPAATSAPSRRNVSTTVGDDGARTIVARVSSRGEEQVVRAALADDDALVGAVDLGVVLDPAVGAHEVRPFDQHVRRRERDQRAALRIDREEADVGLLALDEFDRLAGRVDRLEARGDAEPLRDLAREVDGDADRLAAVAGLREHRIAEVDRDAQVAGRRERLQQFGIDGHPRILEKSAGRPFDASKQAARDPVRRAAPGPTSCRSPARPWTSRRRPPGPPPRPRRSPRPSPPAPRPSRRLPRPAR